MSLERFCGFRYPEECLECRVENQHELPSLAKEKGSFASCLRLRTQHIEMLGILPSNSASGIHSDACGWVLVAASIKWCKIRINQLVFKPLS